MNILFTLDGQSRYTITADSRLAPCQWAMSLQSNAISDWLGANQESALHYASQQPCLHTLQWRHNEYNGVSNYRRLDGLLNRLFSADHRKHQSSASLACVRGIHRWQVDSPHKGPVMRKMFLFDDVIMHNFPAFMWKMSSLFLALEVSRYLARYCRPLWFMSDHWKCSRNQICLPIASQYR